MERTLINNTPNLIKEKVKLCGWINVRRDHGKIIFIDLKDRSGLVQVVFSSKQKEVYKKAEQLRSEWVISIAGTVNERPEKMKNSKVPTGGIEIIAEELEILNEAESLPLDLNVEKLKANLDTILNLRPVTLKHPKIQAVFKIQAEIINEFRIFLKERNFIEIQTPKIVPEATEGGAEVFTVDYFGHKAYLAQSPQFYKQIMVGIFERVFTVGSAYRAEKHDTTRHLNDYVSLDFEMGFIKDHNDIMRIETEWLKHLLNHLNKNCKEELNILKAELPEIKKDIPAISFPEAQEIIKREFAQEPLGFDLSSQEEKLISEYIKKKFDSDFIYVTHYPKSKRPWYTMPDDKNPKFTKSFDLLLNGAEITTGGQRIHNYKQLIESIKKRGINPKNFEFYLQAFRFGMPPEGGLGIGLERFTTQLLKLENIREATLFPRDIKRIDSLISK